MNERSRIPLSNTRRSLGAVAMIAGVMVFGLLDGGHNAAAARSSWQEGCAWREVTPGPGDAHRTYNCTRQRDCQRMADAAGRAVMSMGCIGVGPSSQERPGN